MSISEAPLAVWLAAALALIYLWVFCYRGVSTAKTIVKTASILLLAVVAWQMSASPWLVAALGLCAIGDLLLSREDERSFLAGVGAFALGHLAYILLFLTHSQSVFAQLLSPPQLYLVLGFGMFSLVMGFVLLPRAGDLRIAIAAYIPIITGMGVAALTLPGTGALALLLPGALLFVVSDFVLSLEMFVLSEAAPARRLTPFVVWTTYWSAQLLLFVSLV